jgi:pumilio family protein 6
MAGIKRKSAVPTSSDIKTKSKKAKVDKATSKSDSKHAVKPVKKSKQAKVESSDDLEESDTSEQENGFYGFSAKEDVEMSDADSSDDAEPMEDVKQSSKAPKRKTDDKSTESTKKSKGDAPPDSKLAELNGTSPQTLDILHKLIPALANNSREAHAKQKALAKERKAAKPNADVIERSKKLWEKLRLKSHIQKDERKELVKELFEIIEGRVKDFVFKHDSVRVIQTAIKYSTMEQRRMIARELKGEFRTLAEGKYSKFLIAKLVEKG